MLPGEEKLPCNKTACFTWLGWICTGDGGLLKQALAQCYKVENAALHRSCGERFFPYLSLPEEETTLRADVQTLSPRDC